MGGLKEYDQYDGLGLAELVKKKGASQIRSSHIAHFNTLSKKISP